MVLFALALAVQKPAELPVWTYAYPLPEMVRGGGGGFGGGGIGVGGIGGGAIPAPAAQEEPKTFRLVDFVPKLQPKSYALGDRLDEEFVRRARKKFDFANNPFFTLEGSGGSTSYLLNASNRVTLAMQTFVVKEEDSRERFEAIRTAMERRLGPPSGGNREADQALSLYWSLASGPNASLRLAAGADGLSLDVALYHAGMDRYYAPRAANRPDTRQ